MATFNLFKKHTVAQHANSIAAYLPNDEMYQAKYVEGSNLRGLLTALSETLLSFEQLLNLFVCNLGPLEAVELLPEWERMVGIPDSCFSGSGTIAERQRDVLIKLASLSVQTEEDFENLASLFGATVEIEQGTDSGFFFAADFPAPFFESQQDSKFTIIVNFLVPSPYDSLIECLFRKLAPANCIVVIVTP